MLAINQRNSLILGILANSNADTPLPKASVKSEEKRNFYRKTILSLSDSDRSRIASLTCQPSDPPVPVNPHYLVNLPKSYRELGELPSKDLLRDRINYHATMNNLSPITDDNILELVSISLEVSLFNLKLEFPTRS